MEFVEPTLTAEQRGRILAANTSVSSFEAEASSLVLSPISFFGLSSVECFDVTEREVGLLISC